MSKLMDDAFDGGEALEKSSLEDQALYDSIVQPGARIEHVSDFQTAESIETSFREMMDNVSGSYVETIWLKLENLVADIAAFADRIFDWFSGADSSEHAGVGSLEIIPPGEIISRQLEGSRVDEPGMVIKPSEKVSRAGERAEEEVTRESEVYAGSMVEGVSGAAVRDGMPSAAQVDDADVEVRSPEQGGFDGKPGEGEQKAGQVSEEAGEAGTVKAGTVKAGTVKADQSAPERGSEGSAEPEAGGTSKTADPIPEVSTDSIPGTADASSIEPAVDEVIASGAVKDSVAGGPGENTADVDAITETHAEPEVITGVDLSSLESEPGDSGEGIQSIDEAVKVPSFKDLPDGKGGTDGKESGLKDAVLSGDYTIGSKNDVNDGSGKSGSTGKISGIEKAVEVPSFKDLTDRKGGTDEKESGLKDAVGSGDYVIGNMNDGNSGKEEGGSTGKISGVGEAEKSGDKDNSKGSDPTRQSENSITGFGDNAEPSDITGPPGDGNAAE